MKTSTFIGLLAAVSGASANVAGTKVVKPRASTTLTPITITGNAFYQGSERFYLRGVDYQPGGGTGETTDPIANADACTRDIAYFTKLGINTIRVYTVDNTADHDTCMNALAAAGIYLVLDTDTPLYSINRNEPFDSYNSVYLQSVFATIDAFAGYSNTLAFLSGNEIINAANNTDCAPYIKAVTRDMKQYISSQKYRQIPVGYSAADVIQNQQLMAEYMNCGDDDVRSDFYSINDYSWCDPSSFTTSGWDTLVANYTGYGIPLFMSEYGCNTNTRTFSEVAALYSSEMTGVFSGGLVYEYSEEGNGYGLVSISSSGSVTELADFSALATAFSGTTNPSGAGGASSTSAASTCPAASSEWDVSTDALPSIPSPALAFMSKGAGAGPGLTGAGSQDSGDKENESASTATSESGLPTSTSSGSSTATSKSAAVRMGSSEAAPWGLVLVGAGILTGMTVL